MKKIFVISLALLAFGFSVEAASKKKKNKEKPSVNAQINTDSIAQQIAISLADYDKAITFGYSILAKDPTNINKTFHLARLHYLAKNFEISLNVCSIIISKDSLNINAMQLAALNFVALKATADAVKLYKAMASKFNNPLYLYQASIIEFESNQLDDCLNTINTLLKIKSIENLKIEMTRKNAINKIVKEEIFLPAAAYNIKGFIALKKNDLANAKANFQKALVLEPSFVLAENNLKEVLVKEQEPKQTKPAESK